MKIEVLAPGLLTSVQDGGRRGHAASGVGGAGAMDPFALSTSVRLVTWASVLLSMTLTDAEPGPARPEPV